jgi:hypothetical protein
MSLWEWYSSWADPLIQPITRPLARHIVESTGMDWWFAPSVLIWGLIITFKPHLVYNRKNAGRAANAGISLARWWLKRR